MRAPRCSRPLTPPATPGPRWRRWSATCGPASSPCSRRPACPAARAPRRRTPPAAGSSSCAARACRSTRSAPGSPAKGTPLGRTAVSDILREEGFGRLLRGPAPEASTSPATSGRDTRLPAAAVTDFAALPARTHTTMAGLLLAIPDLVALDLPALVAAAGYPGTRVIPAACYLLSLLALKLTATRRVSHVDDLLTDPAPALLAGLSILPKKTALTDYSYRLSHDHQQRFLAALDQQMIASGPGHRRRGDFRPGLPRRHALGPRSRPGKALRARPVAARPLRADLLRPGHRHPQPGLRQRRPHQGHPEPRGHRLLRPLEAGLRNRPEDADHGPEGHHPGHPRRARRPRRQVRHPADALTQPGQAHQRPDQRGLQAPSPWTGPARTTGPRSPSPPA